MRGKKGARHADPLDPPRRRANPARGHGTFAADRPPVAGVAGRESGQARFDVLETVAGASLRPFVERVTGPDVLLYTDEAGGYVWVAGTGRGHATVCHSAGEWARDDDGDGVREVHNSALEGLWTGLRNFLRPFRGVSKWYLDEYVGIFAWGHAIKEVTGDFIRALCGLRPTTILGP
jgi:transposase